ncbi:MAG: 3-hydroxybutyryl-CoA dehydrogenase [Eubacterium sp.]|nr:3-hydroxybutyryl-CoA dehydrogenase [Eubacterium sp.]MBR1873896.1 3-hydroxybutyryl-CoA dehydrogenase [Eubacterium sp.]
MVVGVIGAGTMGSGIAQAFAQVDGFEVRLCDIKEEFAAGGKEKIKKGLDKMVAKGKMEQADADKILGRIKTGLKDICTDCDLIVEAAFEDMQVKKDTFTELQSIVPKDCIFTSNTSSLNISEIGKGLDRPLSGMHFFNPAARMKLIEVIKSESTTDEVFEKIIKISEDIGKTPVRINEAPGFAVNRILIPMINEAVNVLDAGVASAEDIDIAMQLGCNHPMGPLHLGDYIGLDICLAIMNVIYEGTDKDPKYKPAPLLEKYVADGKLGCKSGEGFFKY